MRFLPLFMLLALTTSCDFNAMDAIDPFNIFHDNGSSSSITPDRVVEPTSKMALALGGVAPGRDELLFVDAEQKPITFPETASVTCTVDPPIAQIEPRPDFASLAAGSGAKLTATSEGVAAVHCSDNQNTFDETYEVTVPPQSLIQILIAEASTQISAEAEIANRRVSLSSQSPTANALASVIRNRINMILDMDDPSLFAVDAAAFHADEPVSYYDAVILADGQFSPTTEDDPTHKTFLNAQDRNFIDEDLWAAYDQAVLTAAAAFNGDMLESAGGAFAYLSPSEEQWNLIEEAFNTQAQEIPDGVGTSDENFPALAPVQILLLDEIWKYDDGRPSFIFTRERPDGAAAVTKVSDTKSS